MTLDELLSFMNYQNIYDREKQLNNWAELNNIPVKEQNKKPVKEQDRAFDLANTIKAQRERIEAIKKAQKEELEIEQKALEEAEKQYRNELNHIRYIGDDKKIEMLIPRNKMLSLIQGLTKAINDNKEAKSYHITINL